ncbi:MAG TPA: bifunctional diaminohydroxyphosphoribosylaminopyrimidine deaminase/5-amino-6-(5-phosphoribosylamino)uracil reductase RibD [Bacteroidales bacterium]|nr:bifunctional diaminohydroxyphosphoribosylaminopyrimidine deaminase/5-amino-6-(5-phosphoribosylamino)uracil reductase RibD [Bacteroidales bacterium]
MAQPEDSIYMTRCLELAARAEGYTSPNPMVGAVVVHDEMIIGEGFHLRAGEPHAEVNAINSVTDKELLKHSTLYVTLEPCSHHGRTPPCADLIISCGIPRVAVGTTDTSAKVEGRGIEKMRQAGIEVITGIEETKCREINKRFFTWNEKKRPYVILKWARSADGFIDFLRDKGDGAEIHWITGMAERVLVHKWRAEEDAILAGGATVRLDDPSLDVRYWKGSNPKRIIVSSSGNLDPQARIFSPSAEILLFTRNPRVTLPGTKVIVMGDDQDTVETVLNTLYDIEIQSLFVEGGSSVIRAFVASGQWDEARRFTGKESFGAGIADPFPEMKPQMASRFESSVLEVGFNNTRVG